MVFPCRRLNGLRYHYISYSINYLFIPQIAFASVLLVYWAGSSLGQLKRLA